MYVVVGYLPDRLLNSGQPVAYAEAAVHLDRLRQRYPHRYDFYAIRSVEDPRWRPLIDPDLLPEPEPYFNEDCPAGCSTEHDAPERGDVFQCPEEGHTYYVWCSACYEWSDMGRWRPDVNLIDGEYLCDPYEHGYGRCEGCSEFVHSDDATYVEDGEWGDCYTYHRRCARDLQSGREGEALRPCSMCNTNNVHLDELTEEFVCDCKAQTLKSNRRPVLMVAA